MKRILTVCMAAVMLLSGCSLPFSDKSAQTDNGESRNISAAVMAVEGTASAEAAYDRLENGIMANIDAQMIKPSDSPDGYDVIYLNSSVRNEDNFDFNAIEEYVKNGGAVVLDNSLVLNFSLDFIGASDLVQLGSCPVDFSYPEGDGDYKNIQELLYDYTQTLKGYVNFDNYTSYQYGYGIVPSTAEVIAGYEDLGVYTVNKYGNGYVFLTNPLLPNAFEVSNFTEDASGEPFASTTAAAENLLTGYISEYVSKKKYGFAVERTFGSYGNKAAAWELHYEDITAMKNDSLIAFSEKCFESGQIPSFTLVRNAYTWFKRAESVTYLLNNGTGFSSDPYEGAYNSGTHIVTGDKWLELDSYKDTESYFEYDKKYTKRAYPFPIDWNEDGKVDFICGSADGNFYYYEGYGIDGNYEVGPATVITDRDGNALNVGSYSSPSIFDIDGDGMGELISGSEDGKIRAFKSLKTAENSNSLAFEYIGDVIDTGLTDCMISTGDLNGDGTTDIAVGSRDGELRVYYGISYDGYQIEFNDYVNVASDETWASPCIYNGTLYSGTLEGYIAKYAFNGTDYEFEEYLEYDDISSMGNSRITIGMNSVPCFADLNGDGTDDLICGSLEYGMAYPIDSQYFPYREELEKQIQYAEDNYLYIGIHNLTHKYATPEHEKRELEYQKSAFESYGLSWDGLGVNQHTWYTSGYGYDGSGTEHQQSNYNGSYMAQYNSGLTWNSGSTTPASGAVPQTAAENAIPMPVYLAGTDFLIMQPCNTPHGNGAYSYTSVKYEMPMLFYNHCDYIYESGEEREQEKSIAKVQELTDRYGYMFVREDQMAKAVDAAYNTDIDVSSDDGKIIISASVRDKNRRLYDERYTGAVGVRIVFAEGQNADDYSVNASVWRIDDGDIYVSLDKDAEMFLSVPDNDIHIEQVNIPADIKNEGDKAVVSFKDDGLMNVRVDGSASTSSEGWTVTVKNGDTVFSKHGKADKLVIER